MSKLFEALNKSQSDLGAVLPPMDTLVAEGAAIPAPLPSPPATVPPATAPPATVHTDCLRRGKLRLVGTAPVLPFENQYASEQYRLLRTRILQHAERPRMIVVSSSGSGDGKTVTAINLAGVLALKGDISVVLIDADFRRSSASRQLGLPESPGLSEVLEGACDLADAVIRTEDFPNLSVIPAGQSKLNPGELLESPRWQAVCTRLREQFQYMILDSPPISAVADYDLLCAQSDGVIVVVRPDHTIRRSCFKALEGIPKDKRLGVVLNCVPDWFLNRTPDYGGHYYAPPSE
jgi:capsular exopolysaccharide synthesis family protein